MKLPEIVLRLINVRTSTTKEGNPYTMVKLADEKTYDSGEFFLSREQSPEGLVPHTHYKVTFEFRGTSASVTLQPAK